MKAINTTKPHGQSTQPRSGSSCAACKLLKRRCTPSCLFAPYFRSDERSKFAKVHKVFGASNVGKILVEVPEEQREDTVNSLAYEAEARLRDPVYGCIGAIAMLERQMVELQHDLALARARLAHYATGEGCVAGGAVVAGEPGAELHGNWGAGAVCSGAYDDEMVAGMCGYGGYCIGDGGSGQPSFSLSELN